MNNKKLRKLEDKFNVGLIGAADRKKRVIVRKIANIRHFPESGRKK